MTDEVATGPETIRRDGVWASWAPSGRIAVPVIVLLVLAANLVGVATVTMLLLGVADGRQLGRAHLGAGRRRRLPRRRPAGRHPGRACGGSG